MTTQKYLFIYRGPSRQNSSPPSPEAMQQMFAAWNGWKEKFKANVLEVGDGLKPSGKILSKGSVTDGPFIESKELVGGFSIISASSYEQALEVAKACPVTHDGETKIEIREMMGF